MLLGTPSVNRDDMLAVIARVDEPTQPAANMDHRLGMFEADGEHGQPRSHSASR